MTKLFYRGPSINVLHEDYAKRGRVDEQAPVRVSEQTIIAAPVARVWALISDPAGWPAIDPDITNVHLDSPHATDTRFTWTNGKARVRSRVAVINPAQEITWTGTSAGSRAVHRYLLEPTAYHSTLVRSEESMAGPMLSLLFPSTKARGALAKWLAALKTAAERS